MDVLDLISLRMRSAYSLTDLISITWLDFLHCPQYKRQNRNCPFWQKIKSLRDVILSKLLLQLYIWLVDEIPHRKYLAKAGDSSVFPRNFSYYFLWNQGRHQCCFRDSLAHLSK